MTRITSRGRNNLLPPVLNSNRKSGGDFGSRGYMVLDIRPERVEGRHYMEMKY